MNRILFTLLCIFSLSISYSQTVVDFEEFDIGLDTFLNGSDANGQFEAQNILLPNDFDPEFQSWLGWSISSVRDSITPGFGNQFAAITATGFDDSQNYAVSFNFSENGLSIIDNDNGIQGLYITNSTFAFLSIRDGDAFAKQFGGETGDDPDFFLLSIVGYEDGIQRPDTVDFYLADYRFEDNSQDFIVSDWSFIDLSQFGNVDSLGFNLSSSDNGQFGMNTPAYFCVDQIIFNDSMTTSTNDVFVENLFDVYPNPAVDQLNISHDVIEEVSMKVYDVLGNLHISLRGDLQKSIDVSTLVPGSYIIHVQSEDRRSSQLFIKE